MLKQYYRYTDDSYLLQRYVLDLNPCIRTKSLDLNVLEITGHNRFDIHIKCKGLSIYAPFIYMKKPIKLIGPKFINDY